MQRKMNYKHRVELATIIGDDIMVGPVLTASDQHHTLEGRDDTLPKR
jgi:hypothetical protein